MSKNYMINIYQILLDLDYTQKQKDDKDTYEKWLNNVDNVCKS